MEKHTSLHLDERLLREAEAILGTSGPTGTVKAALGDVVRRARLRLDHATGGRRLGSTSRR